MEKIFNGKFSYTNVNKCFSGITKSFTSLNHQCKVVPKIIKYEKANTITETFKES